MENKCRRKEKQRIIGNYELLELLGTGSFSSVWLAQHQITNIYVAIKIVNRRMLETPESKLRFSKEIALLKQLHHPFIAELFEIIEDKDAIYCVMENVERGNLLDYINSRGSIDESQARRYFSQLMCALEYLHDKKFIAHRDLKAENILIDKYDNIRLIDFGFSSEFSKVNPELTTACGSPAYAAPEMIQGCPYTKSADIWSAGVVLYAMVAGILPFDDDNTQNILQKIVYTEVSYPPTMSRCLVDLLKRLLTKNPNKRLTISQIARHPWVTQGEYSQLIDFDFNNDLIDNLRNNTIGNPVSVIPNIVDKDIVDQLKSSGFDVSSLAQNLLLDDFSNPVAVVYRMMLKRKLTETTRSVMEALSNKSFWRTTSSVTFQAQPAHQTTEEKQLNENQPSISASFSYSHKQIQPPVAAEATISASLSNIENFVAVEPLRAQINAAKSAPFIEQQPQMLQLNASPFSFSAPNAQNGAQFFLQQNQMQPKLCGQFDSFAAQNGAQFLDQQSQMMQQPDPFDSFPSQGDQLPQLLPVILQNKIVLPKKTRMSLQTYLPQDSKMMNANMQPSPIKLVEQPLPFPNTMTRRRRMSRPLP